MPFALGIYSLLPHLPTACINPSFLVPTHLHPSCIPPSADPPAVLYREHSGYVAFPWSSKPRSATEAWRSPSIGSIGVYRINKVSRYSPQHTLTAVSTDWTSSIYFLGGRRVWSCIFLLWLSARLGCMEGYREDLPASLWRAAVYGGHGMDTSSQQPLLHVMHQGLTDAGGLVG